VIDTYWVLYAIQQEPVSCTGDIPPYILFEPSGNYSGYTGCNHFFGNYRLNSKKLTLDYAGTTKKLCLAQQEMESAFLKMFRVEVWDYKIEKDTLLISGEQGELWHFVAADSISGVKRRIKTPENEDENKE
jgi:putative lipoprotein